MATITAEHLAQIRAYPYTVDTETLLRHIEGLLAELNDERAMVWTLVAAGEVHIEPEDGILPERIVIRATSRETRHYPLAAAYLKAHFPS